MVLKNSKRLIHGLGLGEKPLLVFKRKTLPNSIVQLLNIIILSITLFPNVAYIFDKHVLFYRMNSTTLVCVALLREIWIYSDFVRVRRQIRQTFDHIDKTLLDSE